jgi:Zn-dependent protease with chaperone function
MISVLVVFILGDIEMPDLVAGAPTLLLDLSYSRDFEEEADRFEFKQMTHFDVPVDALASILTKLTNEPDLMLNPSKKLMFIDMTLKSNPSTGLI